MGTRYQHVIWDWNGTLVDDIDAVVETMGLLLERRGLPPMTRERYRDVFEFPVRVYYESVGLDLVAEPFEALAAEWMETFLTRWHLARLRAGAEAALDRVAAAGISQSVLSAAERTQLVEQAQQLGVAERFLRLVGIDDHHAESKIEHGRQWLAQLEAPPEAVLLVGDTTHDVEVAMALGIDVVLVEGGHQSRARLERTGRRVAASLEDVAVLI